VGERDGCRTRLAYVRAGLLHELLLQL
jgi:hypothetical protein